MIENSGANIGSSDASRIGIVEAGSTVTKTYLASPSGIETRRLVGIEFKKNFRDEGKLAPSDIASLCGAVEELLGEVSTVRVYGTSVFRETSDSDISTVAQTLESLGDVSFEVVSPSQEALLTAEGAIADLDFDGNIGVMVGGGGSTEVVVFNGGRLVGQANTATGVGDVNARFPDLSDDLASSQVEDVVSWVNDHLEPHGMAAEILVLAGGNFPLLYENAGYSLKPNPFSTHAEKRYVLGVADKLAQDEVFFHQLRLSAFSRLTPDAPRWWDGTRAMCCVVTAVARQLGCKILVPTRVSMVYGIARRVVA